jgi:hypothetical protein
MQLAIKQKVYGVDPSDEDDDESELDPDDEEDDELDSPDDEEFE